MVAPWEGWLELYQCGCGPTKGLVWTGRAGRQLGGEVDSGYFSRLAHGAGVYHWLKSAGATAGWCPCILIIFCVSRALFKELEAERATETFHL